MAATSYTLSLVGEQHYESAGRAARTGDRIRFKLEPDNPFDPGAIAVVNLAGETLGYVPKTDFFYEQVHAKKRGATGTIRPIRDWDGQPHRDLKIAVTFTSPGDLGDVFTGSYAAPSGRPASPAPPRAPAKPSNWKRNAAIAVALLLGVAMFIGGDETESDGVGTTDATPKPRALNVRLSGELAVEQQAARQARCMKRREHWVKNGTIQGGGASPRIEMLAWNGLTEGQRTEIVEMAACIGGGGQINPGYRVEIRTPLARSVYHDQAAQGDWAF